MFDKRWVDVISPVVFVLVFSMTFRSLDCATTRNAAEDSLRVQLRDTEHIAEHLKEHFGMDEAAAKKYLKENDETAQYFLTHDNNNDSKLDGLEILQALSHHHVEGENKGVKPEELSIEKMVEFVDTILKDHDVNSDGYITYPEFVSYLDSQANMHEDDKQQKT